MTEPVPDERGRVSAHAPTPDRVVFTEDGNRDAWLASDVVVDVDR